MRLVVELKKNAITKIVLNQLFAKTDLQSNFGIINLALVPQPKDGLRYDEPQLQLPNVYLKPQVLTLKQLIEQFVNHRDEVITRRTIYDLKVAKHKMKILQALITAINNIDEVIVIIKSSQDTEEAKSRLEKRFDFDDEQSQAIVDMPLKRLTHLLIEDLQNQIKELQALIDHLEDLLAHHEKIRQIIKDETNELAEKYGDERKTDIISSEVEQINVEDMIKEEDMVVMISKLGYMKRVSINQYKKQGRGGTGSNSTSLLEDDYVNQLFIGSTHDNILFVSNIGKAYWIKVHEIEESSKNSRGKHIRSMIQIGADEEITTVVTLRDFSEDSYLFMTTSKGIVKKVQTSEFSNAKTRGIIGLKLKSDDKLVSAIPTDGKSEVLIVTRRGKALRFNEDAVRCMGRASGGICGMKLAEGDEISGVVKVTEGENVLLLTEKGYGKRVRFEDFNPHGRGTGGQRIFGNIEERGEIIGVLNVKESDEIVCMTSQGKTLRVTASTINEQGTGSTGVKVVKISEPDFLVGLDKVPDSKE